MEASTGESSKGLFSSSGPGRAFNAHHRRRRLDSLDRFAELLSEHTDEADLAAGKILSTGEALPKLAELDPGGNVSRAARRMGLKPQSGNGMLHRLRQRLGAQAV